MLAHLTAPNLIDLRSGTLPKFFRYWRRRIWHLLVASNDPLAEIVQRVEAWTRTYSVALCVKLERKKKRNMNLTTKVKNENPWKQGQEENLRRNGNQAGMDFITNYTAALSTLVETMSICEPVIRMLHLVCSCG